MKFLYQLEVRVRKLLAQEGAAKRVLGGFLANPSWLDDQKLWAISRSPSCGTLTSRWSCEQSTGSSLTTLATLRPQCPGSCLGFSYSTPEMVEWSRLEGLAMETSHPRGPMSTCVVFGVVQSVSLGPLVHHSSWQPRHVPGCKGLYDWVINTTTNHYVILTAQWLSINNDRQSWLTIHQQLCTKATSSTGWAWLMPLNSKNTINTINILWSGHGHGKSASDNWNRPQASAITSISQDQTSVVTKSLPSCWTWLSFGINKVCDTITPVDNLMETPRSVPPKCSQGLSKWSLMQSIIETYPRYILNND